MTGEIGYRTVGGAFCPVLKKIETVHQMRKRGFNLGSVHGEEVIIVRSKQINTRGGKV